jgi:hypothetical protein
MKTIYWVLIVVGVILVLALNFVFFYDGFGDKADICYPWSIEDCDKSCVTDDDCKLEPCAYCMNINQNFSYCDDHRCTAPVCLGYVKCECVDGECTPIHNHPEIICQAVGGEWRTFSNGCVDSCALARQDPNDPIVCTMAFTEGCDCGPDKCWNGETCEAN